MESCTSQIIIWSIIAIVVTIIITSIVWYIIIQNYQQALLNQLTGQFVQNCATVPPVTYREAVYIPTQNGVYEKNLATALYDITVATSSSNCENLLPIPNPPGFNQQSRIKGIDPISGQSVLLSYIFWNQATGQVVISFTGTELPSEWKADFQYQQVAPSVLNGYENEVLVHSGFYNIYLAIRNQIWDWWNQNNSWIKTLYITGHSLGGALSTLCAYDFAGVIAPVHYSFGAPRSGNSKYAQIFNQRVPTSIRVNNTEDIVTALPPAQWDNYNYEQTGGNVPFTVSLNSLADDHILAYQSYLPTCGEVAPCNT